MRSSLANSILVLITAACVTSSVVAQVANPNLSAAGVPSTSAPSGTSGVNAPAADGLPAGAGRIVRDPATGRMFYQQWITETVPTTRWENKQITTTVYETQWVNQVVPSTQTVYQPQTQYTLQPVWKGVWNPFNQPRMAYESKPVTNWVPTTVTTNQVVPRQQVVPKQQTITVPQPITETKTQQRLVQTEIHQPSLQQNAYGASQSVMTAAQPPALFNIPLLARRPPAYPQYGNYSPAPVGFVPPANTGYGSNAWVASNNRPASTGVYPSNPNQGAYAQNALRPVTRFGQTVFPPTYNAPMRTASSQGGSWNSMQSGMAPTVLR
ncbi:MAG: hypothetical protein U0930_06565 [Pirellulales bacterium]